MIPEVLWHMPGNQVYLTFDDGPDAEITPALLDLLDRHQIKATFFVIGRKAENHPEIIARMQAAGHSIGNHTFDHLQLICRHRQTIQKQLQQTDAIIRQITGRSPTYFRPPFGRFGMNALAEIKAAHYKLALWNASTRDYKKSSTAAVIQRRLQSVAGKGKIILLHDGHPNSRTMLTGLGQFLDSCKLPKITFAALPETSC